MKKIVFAAQVLGLIAMFPILVMLEMNHATGISHKNNAPCSVIEKAGETSVQLHEKAKDQMVNEVFPVGLQAVYLIKSF